MTRTNGNQRADINQWTVETLRLTTFHDLGALFFNPPRAEDWWQQVAGAQPENTYN
jgi:hypothetical protein